jgi:hypothetical protein
MEARRSLTLSPEPTYWHDTARLCSCEADRRGRHDPTTETADSADFTDFLETVIAGSFFKKGGLF